MSLLEENEKYSGVLQELVVGVRARVYVYVLFSCYYVFSHVCMCMLCSRVIMCLHMCVCIHAQTCF